MCLPAGGVRAKAPGRGASPLLLTIRRATPGVARPLGVTLAAPSAQAHDLFIALGKKPTALRAGEGVAVALEPGLVSSELMTAVRADDTKIGGELVRQQPYSWHWLYSWAAPFEGCSGSIRSEQVDASTSVCPGGIVGIRSRGAKIASRSRASESDRARFRDTHREHDVVNGSLNRMSRAAYWPDVGRGVGQGH